MQKVDFHAHDAFTDRQEKDVFWKTESRLMIFFNAFIKGQENVHVAQRIYWVISQSWTFTLFLFLLLLPKPRSTGAHVGAHAQTRSRIPEAQRGTPSRFAFWRSDSSCLKHKTAVLYSTRSWAARRKNKGGGTKVRNTAGAAHTRRVCLWMCAPIQWKRKSRSPFGVLQT